MPLFEGARVRCRRGLPQALGHVRPGAPPEAHSGGTAGTHGRPRPRPQLPVHVAAPALPGGREQAASGEHAAGNWAPRAVTSPHASGLQSPPADRLPGGRWAVPWDHAPRLHPVIRPCARSLHQLSVASPDIVYHSALSAPVVNVASMKTSA